jgi:hypothetical protein
MLLASFVFVHRKKFIFYATNPSVTTGACTATSGIVGAGTTGSEKNGS